ncbi:MAG: spinster family MFS transporter [Panacagrimonas sp.]
MHTSRIYPWYVVGILMLAFVFSFVDRQILNLLVGPVRQDLGIGDTQVSLLLGPAFALFFVLAGLPLGRLADSHSRRGLITLGLVFWSLATAACGFARSFEHLFLARACVGIGEAVLAPAAYSLIADYFPRERRATALSVHATGIYIGAGLALMLGGLVIVFAARHGPMTLPLLGETRPWQVVFLVVGAAGILFSPLLLTVREPPRGAQHAAAPLSEVFAHFRRNRRVLLCHNFGFAFLALSGYASAAWLPTFFIRVHGWNAGTIALVYGAIVAVFCIAGVVFGGWLADRWLRRGRSDATLRVGRLAALLLPLLGLLYVFPSNGWIAAALIVPAAFLAGMPTGVAPAALQDLMPANLRGQASALSVLVVNLVGLGLGPSAVALCTDYVFEDDRAVGWSLLVVCGTAQLLAAALLHAGLGAFRESVAASSRRLG